MSEDDEASAALARELLGRGRRFSRDTHDGQELLFARLLADVLDDVRRPNQHAERCGRRPVALAWIHGRHACGCRYESAVTLVDVARVFDVDPNELRARVLQALRPRMATTIRSAFVYGDRVH